jgi:energy-coupling factor transport system substrate-specific component
MKLTIRELTVFSMLGAVTYASKVLMEALPNIHLVGVFIIAFTLVYQRKALYPIYVYVFLTGLLNGFNTWWIPYLYIWTLLWGVVMLLPKRMPEKIAPIVYMVVCGLHGLLYGALYAPVHAVLHGLNFQGMLAWIAAGSIFDITHGVSNFFCGILILPIVSILRLAEKNMNKA